MIDNEFKWSFRWFLSVVVLHTLLLQHSEPLLMSSFSPRHFLSTLSKYEKGIKPYKHNNIIILWVILTFMYVNLCKQGSLCQPLEMVFQPTRDIERVHFLQLLPFVWCSGKSLAGVLPWLMILCSQLLILNRKRYSKIAIAWAIKHV